MSKDIMISTTDYLAPDQVCLGLVTASIVMSKSLVGDFAANMKNWTVGGELRVYSRMINEAIESVRTMIGENAQALGGNAIVGFRFATTQVSEGAAEIIAYGTAVHIETLKQ